MRILWAASAKRQEDAIVRYIAKEDPDAAAKLLEAFHNAEERLKTFPFSGRMGRVAGTRELQIHKHYFLVYEIIGDNINILAVWHTSMDYPACG